MDQCDVCCGDGRPISGRPCMCGGSGKMSDTAIYLRERLIEVERQLEEAKETIKSIEKTDDLMKIITKYKEIILYCYKSCLCERFKTKGFDYGEEHPNIPSKLGCRHKTPKRFDRRPMSSNKIEDEEK